MFNSIVARTRVYDTGAVNRTITLARGQSKYPIKDITGLGPVPSDISRVTDASDRGTDYLSALTGERNIVMRLGFEPDYAANETITLLRLALNKVFMPGNQIELDFDHEVYGLVRIIGQVESNEPVIFSRDPETQISIICTDPYFVDPGPMQSLTLPDPTLSTREFSFTSDLDVPVGFIMDFNMSSTTSPVGSLIISAELPRLGDRVLHLTSESLANDVITFNTIKGERGVTRLRGGTTSDMLGNFAGSLVDSRMYPGVNNYSWTEMPSARNIRFRWRKTYGSL